MKKSSFITSILTSALISTSAFAIETTIATDTMITYSDQSAEAITVNNGVNLSIIDGGSLELTHSQTPYTLTMNPASSLVIANGGSVYCTASTSGISLKQSTATIAADAGNVQVKRIVLWQNSTLVLEKENALRAPDNSAAIIMMVGENATLHAKASQEIGLWDVRLDSRFVFGDANVESNVTLSFNGVMGMVTAGEEVLNVTLENFDASDSIYFSDASVVYAFESDTNTITLYKEGVSGNSGMMREFTKYHFEGFDGNLELIMEGNGTRLVLGASAIPEPAEWASIFGAIALGLAVYRRRK